MQVLCRNSGSTLGYGFATLMEDADDSSSEEDEPLRPMSLTEAVPWSDHGHDSSPWLSVLPFSQHLDWSQCLKNIVHYDVPDHTHSIDIQCSSTALARSLKTTCKYWFIRFTSPGLKSCHVSGLRVSAFCGCEYCNIVSKMKWTVLHNVMTALTCRHPFIHQWCHMSCFATKRPFCIMLLLIKASLPAPWPQTWQLLIAAIVANTLQPLVVNQYDCRFGNWSSDSYH